MSKPRRTRSRSKRSTIPAPPASEATLTEIDQEWDRIAVESEGSRRVLV